MGDGCTIDMEGLDKAMKKLKEFTPKLKFALAADAKNIAAEMEKWAKDSAPWTDRTSHARLFLKSTVKWVNTDELMVAISHGVDYGVYLELANEGKYAILESALQQYAPEFIKGWKKHIEGAGGI